MIELSKPCKCMSTHAMVAPRHGGHCCFFPATQTCHAEFVAEWQAMHARIFAGCTATPDDDHYDKGAGQ
jgi:hypothetical protein